MSGPFLAPRLFKLSDDDLYRELGEAIAGGHAAPINAEETERLGYEYFKKSLPEIRKRVCNSPALISFAKRDDVFALASAIAELITGHFSLPKASGTLAVLAARMGVNALCPTIK